MELPKTSKKIENSKDYVDVDGKIYTFVSNYKGLPTTKVICKTQRIIQGYSYCGLYDTRLKKCVSKRVHKIVAKAFIPNPNNLPVVGHKNNIKTDNRVENLYWTTYSENTQKAVNDGLLTNDKEYDDSQSKPVNMYNTYTNKLLGQYGSIIEASQKTGIAKTTISRQSKYKRPTRKSYYFRYQDDLSAITETLVGMFEYDTDKLIQTFINKSDAAKKTGRNEKIIGQQCNKGKPKARRDIVYFNYVTSKCEQTIENR